MRLGLAHSSVIPSCSLRAEAYEPPPGFPDHFRVAAMLQQEPNGLVPYADVAFDVGPGTQFELRSVWWGSKDWHSEVLVE
ncbi:BTB domain-containing protein [Durusdinium trenchii]|uniref:BTB domain-containing protein n=1 Tax=Durusdinium trenchii TaxID=1381693 RepID=A0ABP0PGM3_9DINO